MRELFSLGRSSWITKYELLQQLKSLGENKSEISKKLDIKIKELNRFEIHRDIPLIYVPDGIKNNSGTLLNEVFALNVHDNIKDYLYKRAILPEKHNLRITHSQIAKIKSMLKNTIGYHQMTIHNQINFLKKHVLNFEEVLIHYWQQMIDEITPEYYTESAPLFVQ